MEYNFENCGYYTDGECNICGMGISGEDTFCKLCKDNPNCYYKQNTELKAENDKLKEEIGGMQILIDNYIALTEKYHKVLQEIKEIAEDAYENESEYQATGVYNEIIQKITKAEEE